MTYDPNYNNGQPNYQNQPGYNQQSGSGYSQQRPEYNHQDQGITPDAKNMAIFAHLSSLLAMLLSLNTLSFIAPLIFWLIYKDKPGYEFTKESSRRAFNFNFSMWVINTAAFLLMVITLFIMSPIWFLVVSVTGILMIIFHILGAIAANRGEMYDYPMTFIKILK